MSTKTDLKASAASRSIRLAWVLTLSLTMLCLAPLLAPVQAQAQGTYVFDEYGLFTDSQLEALEAEAADIAQESGIGVYFLTTDTMDGNLNPTSSQRNSFAKSYYTGHSLGVGPDKDGIIFVVAVTSRDYVTWANGLPWTEALSEKGIDAMEEAVTDRLSDDEWYAAAEAYYREMGSQLRYYVSHGKAQEPLDLFDWIVRILIVLIIPLAVALGFVARGISAMRTARKKSEAGAYLQAGSLVVTQASDRFLHTTHTATKRSSDNDGGGGGWGGGGGSGGSGGGKF